MPVLQPTPILLGGTFLHESTAGTDPWILVTNDDGIDSPFLLPLIRRLSDLAPVQTLVPASERSWTGKIMSRFTPLQLNTVECDGFVLHTLDGFPADCANLGIHGLCPTKPALVVSGVNIGSNAGLAYFLSSGTVGAAIEGALSGVPAAAFSMRLEREVFASWHQGRPQPDLDRLGENAAQVTGSIVAELLTGGLPQNAPLLTVNMPHSTTLASPRRFTELTPTAYGAFFTHDARTDRYVYASSKLQIKSDGDCGDIAALDEDVVALTAIQFSLAAIPQPRDRERFERS
ncbi:MAG: 5'/3'-nucleotidase SurE [Candidatus Latescibacteria bacterium]|nr:5'/3'-nucleotidase SurE [Candidatus Latescibacterota bacterium]